MRIVALQRRQDHDTSLYGTAALAALLAAASAWPLQSATAQGAVPCTAIADDAERLACYDRALRGPPPEATPPRAAQAAPRSASPAAAPAAPAAAPPAATEPRRAERRVRESAAPAAPPAPRAPAAGSNDAEEQIIPLVIVSTRALPGRETTFTAQDGTRWVQTDSQRITGLPETPFDAEIKPGTMGSYFLVAKDRQRAIRVRPVR
jgi:hypothetical protein